MSLRVFLLVSILAVWLTLFAYRIASEREAFIYPSLRGFSAAEYARKAAVLLSVTGLVLVAGWFLVAC